MRLKGDKQHVGKVILAFAAIYFVWGSTYFTIKLALESFPPFILAGIRFLIAGLLLFGWCKLKRNTTLSIRNITQISLSGILLLYFGSGSVIWVEQYLTSGLTSIIWASLPIWLVVLDKSMWSFYFSNIKTIIGLIIGFIGVVFLVGDRKQLDLTNHSTNTESFFVAAGGVIVFALGSLYMKYQPAKGSPYLKASIQMIAAGILSLFTAFSVGEHLQISWNNISLSSIISLLYLIVMGSLAAYVAYVWLITIKPPALVGTYTYVNPLVAILMGWFILGENITMQGLYSLLLILLGVFIINIYKSKRLNNDSKNVAW